MSYWNLFIFNLIAENMLEVLANYELGEIKEIKKVYSGIMNDTYLVKTEDNKFILQKIRDKRITRDHNSLESIWDSEIKIPNQILSRNGNLFHKHQGNTYRVMHHIENDDLDTLTYEVCFNLGESLAEFHIQTKDFKEKLAYSIPNFHNTRAVIDRLNRIKMRFENSEKWNSVSKYYDTIVKDVEDFYLPNLSRQLIHGDPKWQNFLYTDKKVNAIIDFETLMYGNELIDIGDGLRSWSKDEDYNFDKIKFESSVAGYLSKNKNIDESLIPQATALITLELSARFLTDYFIGSEFKLSDSELFDKLKNQMKFYEDMKSQLKL